MAILRWMMYFPLVIAAAAIPCHRTPYLLKYSVAILTAAFLVLFIYGIVLFVRKNRRDGIVHEPDKENKGGQSILSILSLAGRKERFVTLLLGISFLIGLGSEANFQWKKYRVLHADKELLKRLGAHFIIGYEGPEAQLESATSVFSAGFFISHRNVAGKSHEALKKEIDTLKGKSGSLPFFIAADQEGGPVSRLSPPLQYLPAFSSCIDVSDWEKSEACIREYARKQGRGLASLGVNLNLSPVVDLQVRYEDIFDLHTKIADRALSPDPEVVSRAALVYCKEMENEGLLTTLKHFPGLGRVNKDTHHFSGKIYAAPELLEKSDWIPFRRVSRETASFIMLGHVIIRGLDREYHASHSEKVVRGLIRDTWKHNGVLITDDFCMNPVYFSSGSIGGAAVRALNGGVDLILVSYHPERYYEAMCALLEAAEAGTLNWAMIDKSAERLRRVRGEMRNG